MDRYILTPDGDPVPEPDLMAWGRWLQNNDALRVVGKTRMGAAVVSTVFLGLNHAFTQSDPILFETMVFWDGHALDSEQERYSTLADAKAGHERWCQRVADERERVEA